jgi:hypothetical protein
MICFFTLMNQLYGTYKTEQTSVLLSAIPNAETYFCQGSFLEKDIILS